MPWQVGVIQVTQFVQNCSLICPEGGGPAVLVDPGGDWDRIAAAIEQASARVEAVLLTHGHLDHIGAVPEAAEATDSPVYLHPDDLWLFEDPGMGMFPRAPVPVPEKRVELGGGDVVEAAGLRFDVLYTPGHSPGHVCYLTELDGERLLLGGDLVFMGSIGRTDFPGGDVRQLARSVKERIWPLPDDTTILPGHGPATTIGREKATNPFVGLHVIEDLLT